jgi:putative ABC transport system permease protein
MLENQKVALFLAVTSLKRGSMSSLALNVIIIAMVFTNMILLSSIINGSVTLFNEQTIDYSTSDILIQPAGEERYITDVDSLLDTVNRVPGVARAAPRYELGATLNHKAKSISIAVTAIRPRDEIEVTKINTMMKDGEFLSSGDQGEIILGQFLSGSVDETMDFYESLGGVQVGDSVEVNFANGETRDYRVKGIFATKSYTVDYTALITWDEMDDVLGYQNNQATRVLVRTVPGEDIDTVKTNILSFGVGDRVRTWQEAITKAIEDAIEQFNIINGIIVVVSLIIAVVIIFIVTMIKAINNRRQIGLLKAIGIDQRIIIQSYVMQVMVICILGIIVGLITVWAMMVYFTAYPIEFPDGDITPTFDAIELANNAVILFLTSAVAGYVPAWKIARERILDAMRGAK